MASLLSFAWRKSQTTAANGAPTMSFPQHLLSTGTQDPIIQEHLGVSASASDDTLAYQPSFDSIFSSSRASCLDGPGTPDALRCRKTVHEIREELGLPCKKLDLEPPVTKSVQKERTPQRPVLPPMVFGVHSSLPSPRISVSSFYSKMTQDTEDNVARSPSLRPGEAKTAVGALLAMSDTKAAAHATELSSRPPLTAESSILPSREWLRDDRSVDDDLSIELPYESLNESQAYYSHQSRNVSDSDSDEESSMHSNRPPNLPDTSFTRGFLEAETSYAAEKNTGYDFHFIANHDLEIDEPNSMNQSCMSQSTARDIDSMCSLGGKERKPSPKAQESKEERFRSINERRIQQDLLISILERLQDDNDMVLEILDSLKEAERYGYVVMRPGQDNLFSGYSSEQREAILQHLKQEISTCQRSKSEESLKEALSFCQTLVEAAIPVHEKRSTVQCPSTAIIPEHIHRWRCVPGFRASLGFDEAPHSPQTVRGGDTSLFSLPSESGNDSTPHTSNLSMTSTITSAVSPDRSRRQYHTSLRDGVRQSLEISCIAFDKLSQQLLVHKSSRAIQRIYEEMLKIPKDDIKALIDSFELDVVSLGHSSIISRIVSQDNEDEYYEEQLPLVRSWEPIETGVSNGRNVELSLDPVAYLELEDDEEEERENQDIFSPNTADMQSLELPTPLSTADTIDDDLRRTVGSFDSEDLVEDRDGPPAMELQRQAMRGRKSSKSRRSFFGRRSFRRRQAAE